MLKLFNKKKKYFQNFYIRLNNWIRRHAGVHYRRSYSQCGEDIIVKTIFDMIGIAFPTYLDIGAHHPYHLNNTYIFYRSGSRGVNVEPDPDLYSKFTTSRRRDVVLNVGIGIKPGVLELKIMSSRTLNTFSSEEARKYELQGFRIQDKISVPVITINQLLSRYCASPPDFLSIDVEGMDYEILKSLNFTMYRPIVICVETISFSNSGLGVKRLEIDELFIQNGYYRFADTYINSIYVDTDVWKNRSVVFK